MRILTMFLLLATASYADTVTLRDGRTVLGSFLGGDARSVRVAVGDRVETYSIGDITSISFDGGSASSAAPVEQPRVLRPEPRSSDAPRLARRDDAPPPPPAGQQMIPNGTVLTIRMVDSVDSQRDSLGMTYKASLDEPVMDSSGNTMVPRGANVVVKLVDDQQSGKIEGRTVLTLDLVSLNINGRDVEIDTTSVKEQSGSRGARSGKVIGGTAALGAIIGAIAGGGKGAAIGTVAGAGAGTAAEVATKGQRVHIPSEMRLTFTLQQAVRF
ncbi:MAG TPA: hypothetical protein VGR73_23740 [Bryobacteraceae bacterium]|nr:hypothetical protein [Bryobacteraceae bacterium]